MLLDYDLPIFCIVVKNVEHSAVSSPDDLCVFVLCWGGNTFCKKSNFCVLNDPEFLILIQVYFNHSGCFNVTKIPLHRKLFLRVSCRRGGSGGKAGESWVGKEEG